jgi:thioredoxin reductase (NADPH)
LRTLILEPAAPGGQAGSSSRIENYLGFPTGVTGAELAQRAYLQAMRFGVEFLTQEALSVRFEDRYRIVKLGSGQEISCHVLLLAMGVDYRRMEIPGLEEFTGAGVYYGAALSEAKACQNESVYIVGGANSAGQAAVYFSQYAKEVVMIVRAGSLESSMSKYLIDQIAGTSNTRVHPSWRRGVAGGIVVCFHRCGAEYRLASGDRTEGPQGLSADGPGPDARWEASGRLAGVA